MKNYALVGAAFFAGIGFLFAASDDQKEAVTKDLEALKGTWRVVSAERDGKKLSDEQVRGVAFTIYGDGKAVVKNGDEFLFEGTKAKPSRAFMRSRAIR